MLALDDRMASLTKREQVVERRGTSFASRHDLVDMERGGAHSPAALARVPVSVDCRGSS
jgi:hypothetical protein